MFSWRADKNWILKLIVKKKTIISNLGIKLIPAIETRITTLIYNVFLSTKRRKKKTMIFDKR